MSITAINDEKVQINVLIEKNEKDKLQHLADINCKGRITRLIKMLANGKDIKR